MSEPLLHESTAPEPVHWVDQVIANSSAGVCMCGRSEGVEYGPHPFGYGMCCVWCQKEWQRQHGGARWRSNAEMLSLLDAEQARAQADGRDVGEVVTAWNQGTGLFERPKAVTRKLSETWKRDYEAWKRDGWR